MLVTEGPGPRARARGARRAFRTERRRRRRVLLAREGGHSLARVVHAGGDATGAEIERALVAAVERRRHRGPRRLVRDRAARRRRPLRGVLALDPTAGRACGRPTSCSRRAAPASASRSPPTPRCRPATASRSALRAGVACADLEFVQFHPTALHHPSMPRPLLSEALRGEGAVLRDGDGVAFMAGRAPARRPRAPRRRRRARSTSACSETGADHVWLDATMIDDFPNRFPTIWHACQCASGLDPTQRVAAGGARRALPLGRRGRPISTARRRCLACGRAARSACSGVHGANRLASNSLLDGLVFGRRVVEAIATGKAARRVDRCDDRRRWTSRRPSRARADPRRCCRSEPTPTDPEKVRGAIQRTMSTDCGVVHDADGLAVAALTLAELGRLAGDLPARRSRSYEVRTSLRGLPRDRRVAAARARSRVVSHTRADYPETSDAFRGRFVSRGDCDPSSSPLPAVSRATHGVTDFDPPRAVVQALVAGALAEDLGVLGDITSLACIDDDARPRPRSSPAPTACSPAPRSRPRPSVRSTEVDGALERCTTATSVEARRAARPGRGPAALDPHGRAGRAQLPVPLSGVATMTRRFVRGRARPGAHPRHPQDHPGLRALEKAAVRAGGGFNHRDSLSRRGAHQGQPPRRPAASRTRSSGRASRWPGRHRSRSSATRSSR